ncbi:DNA alkylation repair protein [Agrococcus carbonis]|uniref:3-methyladenine DNA glycosylase AlkD n=1 Tax=Agrococcus carbonis TaxID=684552 RepID=A0A1H1ND28_9MICO|nr:DNA alkylation repair protein [Agrococcus carbonis]SDR96665.1 3-methyladenine DNA glycosylase AlkD [Agrococcus carbonis]
MTETVAALQAELAALEDPRMREVNERHGDDHGVNLAKVRAIAKRLGTDHEFALALWATGETPSRLLALLIARPKSLSSDELDAMLREARAPKVLDWLVNYLVKKGPHAEALRLRWIDDADAVVAAAGWALTSERLRKARHAADVADLDLPAMLDTIEAEMADAPERLMWAMNEALATIGITQPALRERARGIGERLGVLKDYPVARGCISPYAPIWIDETVARQGASRA